MAPRLEAYRVDRFWSAAPSIMPGPLPLAAAPGHNTLGYRGSEPAWHEPHVVYVGDERTKGDGVDDHHRWTTRIAARLGALEINFGRADASNEWIAAQAIRILELQRPRLVVQWTDPRRYLYADERGRYRDFLPARPIGRAARLLPNRAERARRAFYEIDTPGLGLHRLMLNSRLLAELAAAMGSQVVQVCSFLDDASLAFLRPRVDGVTDPVREHDAAAPGSDWLVEAVLEKLR